MPEKILIIKLGALGDIVRTLPLLPSIKEKYPDSNITWITRGNAREILEYCKEIDSIITLPIKKEIDLTFDILYNFDIEEQATELAKSIQANKKYGFSSEGGFPISLNFSAEEYLNTLFDDELKKSNKKTYQEMMFNVAELLFNKNNYSIHLSREDKEYANNFIQENNINTEKLIGIHIGASLRWPSKVWSEDKLKEFIIKAKNKGYEIMLFAGKDESEKQERLISEFNKKGIKVYKNNPSNTIKEFISLISICSKMICSDSLSLHLSLALQKPTIGLFFCTSPDEIESYGLLKRITSPKLYDFFPEKMDEYSEELVNSLSADEVLEAIEK